MRETSENLPKPSKKLSHGSKNQSPREDLAKNFHFFWPTSGVPASRSWGSNPDRSPVAQWLNMRISPASRLPGDGGTIRTTGEVFRNHNTGSNSPPFQTLGPGVGGKPRTAGEVFRNHNTGPNSPPFKTLARPDVGGKPCAAGKVLKNDNTGGP